MNFGSLIARTDSPATNSRNSSPVRSAAKKAPDDASTKNDKAFRRYAATIEKTLATWEIAPEEWADYIAFLSRLLKAIQSGSSSATTLPHSDAVASKLAQCLNPGLPSGVHQKALEVYAYIFAAFGKDHVANQLNEYLPGLLPLLSFASLSVRPALYDILEDYVVCLQPSDLRPVLKSFILSILPALEDETSEDFDRALTTLTRLEHNFLRASQDADLASFYWQSIFLSIITSPSRRQGALSYLVRRLPKFIRDAGNDAAGDTFPAQTEAVISPEPGLLLRAFACGLSDTQTLVQRGFLDLLTTHIPLNSPLLQTRIEAKDFQLLISSAMSVLLRRDMSLNRRVWQWFLGPEPKDEDADSATSTKQLDYIIAYGLPKIELALLNSFDTEVERASERIKPFRIGLSLMDRWEIGGTVVPRVFLPAMRSAWRYSQVASQAEQHEFMKGAKLFFDGVESKLIWSRLLSLLNGTSDDFQLLLWILSSFNVKEEEMATVHAPTLSLYALSTLSERDDLSPQWHNLVMCLVGITSSRISSKDRLLLDERPNPATIKHAISAYYSDDDDKVSRPYDQGTLLSLLVDGAQRILQQAMAAKHIKSVARAVSIYLALQQKFNLYEESSLQSLLIAMESFVDRTMDSGEAFMALNSVSSLLHAIAMAPVAGHVKIRAQLVQIGAKMTPVLLSNVSPSRCKHNIEAVRLLWRLDALLSDELTVQAAIQALVTNENTSSRRDDIRTFLNLWNLSTGQSHGTTKSPMPGLMRRASSTLTADNDRALNQIHLLQSALMSVLDTLHDPADEAFDIVCIWLNSSTHIDAALMMLFDALRDALREVHTSLGPRNHRKVVRSRRDGIRALVYALGHFDKVLEQAQLTLWTVLSHMQLPGTKPNEGQHALTALVEQCIMLLPGEDTNDIQTHQRALAILNRVMSAPSFVQAALRMPAFGTIICERLLSCVTSNHAHSQAALLDLSMKALKWQHVYAQSGAKEARAPPHSRKMSVVSTPSLLDESSSPDVPSDLLARLLRSGLSAPACRQYLDVWVRFAEEALPIIGPTITTVLIPLTEVVCLQITETFESMLGAFYKTTSNDDLFAPEVTIARMLDVLEILLRGAHDVLFQDEGKEEQTAADSTGASTSTVLSNMTPNIFKSQGPPSKTASANQRLTTILASKDVATICIRIWLWASDSPDSGDLERQSSSTIAHVALRLRNKARHMLDEMFHSEPLESLEVVVAHWTTAEPPTQKELIISLLHVLRELRPNNTVPAILDALLSRTNPSLLTPARQSTLASDLSASDLVLFWSAYLNSLEHDALVEVWPDCSSFFRDVLANPLPHRQILPALIWIVYQLAQKLENTNYGERKRMRKELGDNFLRLLGATFAALPSGSTEISDGPLTHETPFNVGLREMNLVVVLREVIERAELFLETSDRVAMCINTVSVHLLTPTLRSKTFPQRINADILGLALRVAKKSPSAKAWRKEIADAFNDPRFVASPAQLVEQSWFPILSQWVLSDKERMSELIGRLYAPSSAGIMFGVGASAARLDADRKTQLNFRRIALLLLASPLDSHVEFLKVLQEKIVELFEASATSSPSTAVKAELFMLIRAMLLSISAVHFAPMWPIVNDNIKAALLELGQGEEATSRQTNLSLLQCCKLLDFLAATAPDDFQLFEWIYYTNTTDAVYHSDSGQLIALFDKLGAMQRVDNGDDGHTSSGVNNDYAMNEDAQADFAVSQQAPKSNDKRMPMLLRGAGYDTEDVKVMSRDTFANAALRPFLSQMSISLYESRYRMEAVDIEAFRRALLDDLQDAATVVPT